MMLGGLPGDDVPGPPVPVPAADPGAGGSGVRGSDAVAAGAAARGVDGAEKGWTRVVPTATATATATRTAPATWTRLRPSSKVTPPTPPNAATVATFPVLRRIPRARAASDRGEPPGYGRHGDHPAHTEPPAPELMGHLVQVDLGPVAAVGDEDGCAAP